RSLYGRAPGASPPEMPWPYRKFRSGDSAYCLEKPEVAYSFSTKAAIKSKRKFRRGSDGAIRSLFSHILTTKIRTSSSYPIDMITRLLSSLLLLAFVLGRGHSVFAFETDQYNLPPEPLADIGQEFALYVRDGIQLAVDDINAQIALHTTCLAEVAGQRGNCGS